MKFKLHHAVGLALLGLLCAKPAVQGQSAESENAPAPGEFIPAPTLEPDQPYLIPDIPDSFETNTQVRTRWLTIQPGVVFLVDYSGFQQDSKSISQVGKQDDQWDPRSVRLMFRGTIGTGYKIKYLVAGEYEGFESDPGQKWSLTDASLTFPLGDPASTLTVGKTKETFVYEMVGDAANLPQQERILSPFFVSRDTGVKFMQVFGAQQRATLSVGVFNDWLGSDNSVKDSGTDVTLRFTGLLWDQPDKHRFFHLGLSGRYAGADNDVLRYRARPESNVTGYYLDTGDLSADHAWNLGVEALWNEGPFSVLAEYTRAWVDSASSGNPEFYGYYVTGSWILTGETRPYDRTVGYARRVMPTKRWGAPELVVRYSHIDLDDQEVSGGKFDKTYVGINWWATRRFKVGFGWGHTWLDRFNTTGNTDSYQVRFQWIY